MIAPNGLMPRRATIGSAGYDFHAPTTIHLIPGQWVEVDTGVCLTDADFPTGLWFMMLVPRSGLGFRYGVKLSNTIGIIDMDYRQNIRAKITSDVECTIEAGDTFMQGILVPFGTLGNEVAPTLRREGGFGSTDRRWMSCP